ncbi:TPA: TIR domain-containing protein [Staphylococcus aureus]|nr:TIR domain-containing protein [Staphylococcus aureus]HDP5870770.1 TIR domain-containing protein [Staphylococcus aureus]HDP5926216.1 TIR domain-containing protein [Staphylococcus aureus]HDP6029076.1 TIR domain-containing protein [Staphylococcus aureus]HDP6109936.1 TIR domain-containing protein [Staphylococcus aureus]
MTKKVFISYSWTSESHKNRIVKIAESLMQDHGIDIILDLWDCKPGQDLNAFMESMVLNKSIDYVLIMSDERYKAKANSREGGVGTESTIISTEVYKDVSNTKFIPVYMEMINGEVSLPQFCKTRRAINMTNEEDDYESIEEIARWINNKPIYIKPAIGKVPDYNFNNTSLKSYEQKLYISKSYTLEDNLMSYFDIFKTELLKLENESDNDVNNDIILSIKPYLESLRRFYDFVSEKELDVSLYIVPLYNDLLEYTANETERPLLRLLSIAV